MRRFALGALLGIAALNCFLGYSGQALVNEIREGMKHYGTKFSNGTLIAFDLQPWFYLVAVAAIVIAGLGIRRKVRDDRLVHVGFSLLLCDVAGLLATAWGIGSMLLRF